ncbi:microcephalin isoform X2 [Melanotaenia boesemani]|uniref:microcephalin isoform X2 n=1 Tax=Melanotaenia boesemani TaxID=1250792 RepID=UPI001C0453B7|nr:microcephalin isoform X2 [Melanotaenia boesemani]
MATSNNSSVLKDVVAFVDVWSSDKRANYSQTFIQQLQEMGAQVSKRFNKQVTHVVFSNGHPTTWRNAKKSDVRLVSVLWVRRCYEDGVRVDEDLFPALNDESNPVMKNRKHRCMLPKDSPEKTTKNDWRMKKKLEKLMKDLPSKEPLVSDVSPIIIDEKSGIIYSPGLKRSEYMAQRLKDMKDKRESLSPTATQMAESCSPTELKPSLGSTPTVFKFKLDGQSDVEDSSADVAEFGCSPDKEDLRSHLDVGQPGHLEQDSVKPWLSPCRDVPKRISAVRECLDFMAKEDEEGNKQAKLKITSVRKQLTKKPKSGDFLQSPVQHRSDKTKNFHQEKRQSQTKSSGLLPDKSEKAKQTVIASKSFTDTKSCVHPNAVNSLSCLSSLAMSVDAAAKMSEEMSLSKDIKQKTPKRPRMSLPALMQSFTLSSGSKSAASNSIDGDNDAFEDYFTTTSHKKCILPNLSVDSDIQIPFELDSVPKKRKQRQSESFGASGKKKRKVEESHCSSNVHQHSHESSETQGFQQQDAKTSLTALEIPTDNVTPVNESTLALTSTRKTTSDAGKQPLSASGQPSLGTEDFTTLELQKNSDFTVLPQTLQSGEKECTVAAGCTEILSETEQNHNKKASVTIQTMVNKTKTMRTLVMTSMPTERTLNILLGIARGCWILSFEWILWCLEQRQWIPEEPYELSEQFPAAQICRLQRHLSAGEHQQDLFQGQPAMFVSQHSQPPTQSLVELIELCGGTVCKTVRQAGICIGKYNGRRPEGSRILSEQWILDSISNLKISSYDNYDLE